MDIRTYLGDTSICLRSRVQSRSRNLCLETYLLQPQAGSLHFQGPFTLPVTSTTYIPTLTFAHLRTHPRSITNTAYIATFCKVR
ncbi:hypothetical protein CGGC5_v007850 [Colletotrichum fructicola Nara gc5]|uniref:Uncharacterized protein n=1 Tax=Colletotrichum fructicola (strain Nara gc5) TaxID=1213859 RepID=A0A7J6J1J5_COLFN|nr:hypothetical protein CGGC5_v007850 [Colletotrichum fructicola Nara gc5]